MKLGKIKKFWLRLWIDKNEFAVKDSIRHHCHYEDIIYENWDVTNIKVKTRRKFIVVTIYAQRPGLVIGRGGETINGIEQWLNDDMGKPVKVKIVETDIWKHKGFYYAHQLK